MFCFLINCGDGENCFCSKKSMVDFGWVKWVGWIWLWVMSEISKMNMGFGGWVK